MIILSTSSPSSSRYAELKDWPLNLGKVELISKN